MASEAYEFVDLCREQPLNLADHAALGDAQNPWIIQHGDTQQDAAEFAGWFRAQILGHCHEGQISAGWQKFFLHSTEDQSTVLAPLLLQCREPQKAFLQELIDEWHQSDPYVCGFPNSDCKFYKPIFWNRIKVLIPLYDEAQGFSVTWHNFHTLASVLHLDPKPQSDYSSLTMNSLLNLLIADNDEKPNQIFMHEDIVRENYLF